MFDNFVSGGVGIFHLVAAILALIFGSFVLADAKGTNFHRRVGYLYAISMLALNISALMIYRLFGRFGAFHAAAIISLLTLLAGMIPVILRRPRNHWFGLHFNFMFWSVFGLYAAFVAELAVRLPIRTMFTSARTFFTTVAVATLITMCIGQIIMLKKKKQWEKLNADFDDNKKALITLDKPT